MFPANSLPSWFSFIAQFGITSKHCVLEENGRNSVSLEHVTLCPILSTRGGPRPQGGWSGRGHICDGSWPQSVVPHTVLEALLPLTSPAGGEPEAPGPLLQRPAGGTPGAHPPAGWMPSWGTGGHVQREREHVWGMITDQRFHLSLKSVSSAVGFPRCDFGALQVSALSSSWWPQSMSKSLDSMAFHAGFPIFYLLIKIWLFF